MKTTNLSVKKALSMFLSLVMLFTITTGLYFSSYAYTYTSGDYEYQILNDGTAEITAYKGNERSVSIPAKLGNYSVSSIGFEAFYEKEIQELLLPKGIKNIGMSAFDHCNNLNKISLSDTVKTIDAWAFSRCKKLESIVIPKSVQIIGVEAFSSCDKLKNVQLNAGLKEIGAYAFSFCSNLKTIKIPDTVLSMGPNVFKSCKNLTTAVISNNVKEILMETFCYCDKLTTVTMPEKLEMIGGSAFSGCYELKNITIPKTVKQIGRHAFRDCRSLKNITISSKVNLLDKRSFYGCTNLTSITIPNSVTYIDEECFAGCPNLTDVDYIGTKNEWKKIYIADGNGQLAFAKIHYRQQISSNNVKLSSTSYTYNGKAKKPSVTVKDSKGNKIASNNYTVTYQSGRKNVGKYTVTVKFKGNYIGTVKKTFTIKPKATTISKVTAGKKAFTVKWKKQATQTTGYQIQYSTDKNFKKNNKTVTISKNKTTSKKISKLSAKKKYYVRIRTYKTVNGTKYCSAWSKAKTVKTK